MIYLKGLVKKMNSLLIVENITFVIASAFVVCIIAGVFQMSYLIEKMGDDKK